MTRKRRYPCLVPNCRRTDATWYAAGHAALYGHICGGCWVKLPAEEKRLYRNGDPRRAPTEDILRPKERTCPHCREKKTDVEIRDFGLGYKLWSCEACWQRGRR